MALLLLASGSSGCAYALVTDGQIDPLRLRSLAQRTAQVSGSQAYETYEARPLPQAELPALVESLIRDMYSDAELHAMQRSLEILGLWPVGVDYVGEIVRVTGEEVAGIYVPEQRTLYVIEDFELPLSIRMVSALAARDFMRETVLAHEIVHAYQHVDYPELFEQLKTPRQNDLSAALQAAIEGDATRYGFAALLPDGASLPDANTFLVDGEAEIESDRSGALGEAPAILRLTLAFPYTRGYGLSVREDRALLTAPPASTEQVLHEDRRRASFWAIDLAALDGELPNECTGLYEDSLGELAISVLFRDLGGEGLDAAWDGWDGDRFLAAECDGVGEFLWWTEWDSEDDAKEFAEAYREIAPSVAERGQLHAAPEVHAAGRRVTIATRRMAPRIQVAESGARRVRVASVDEVLAHFSGSPASVASGSAAVPRD